MKLLLSPMSPYARKARIALRELSLLDRVEEVSVSVSPINPSSEVTRNNPLGKIPVLVLDDGSAVFDSPVICEYLDGLGGAHQLVPQSGPQRWAVLCRQALADGALDAAVLMRYELHLRPPDFRWLEWLDGQRAKVLGALDQMEREAGTMDSAWNLATISTACVLGYLDFRFADLSWRSGRTRLRRWYEEASQRPSFRDTWPPE
jgi:glutathione S-transferase